MDRLRVARRLLTMARAVLAADPKKLLKDLKSIEITFAEGPIRGGLPDLAGKKFTTVAALEKAVNKYPKPDLGYDKCDILVTFRDGSQLKSFRYDHGQKDLSLSKQLDWYIKNRVTAEDE